MVVLQQCEHSCVNNSRPAGEEVIRENEEKGSEGAVQKRTFNHFPRLQLKTFDGHTHRLIGLSMFQNLSWVYGMAWVSVRFPGLKFCPSPPLPQTPEVPTDHLSTAVSQTQTIWIRYKDSRSFCPSLVVRT